jgi:hypothetical protein
MWDCHPAERAKPQDLTQSTQRSAEVAEKHSDQRCRTGKRTRPAAPEDKLTCCGECEWMMRNRGRREGGTKKQSSNICPVP